MASQDWRIRGPQLSTCNCSWGCPCQFNALPTNGDCRAAVAMEIREGHFGETRLDGLRWIGMLAWPGAIHEGHGECQVVIDERASPEQRQALLAILSGKTEDPPKTILGILATTLETMHEPIFRPITFESDMGERRGRFAVDGIVEATAEPIRNPITGEEHRASVNLPDGFEYKTAEYGSSTTRATGAVRLDWTGRHAHFADLHLTPGGAL